MQKVTLTLENNQMAYSLLRIIEQLDFVHSIQCDDAYILDEFYNEPRIMDWKDIFYV
jgi:hypothetical protein